MFFKFRTRPVELCSRSHKTDVDRFKGHFLNIIFLFFTTKKKFEVFLYFEKKNFLLEITEREPFPRSIATSNAGLAIAP